MDSFATLIALKVRAELERRGKSVSDMSEATGISSLVLTRRLDGASAFTADEIVAVASFFGMDVKDLLGGTPVCGAHI